LHKTQLEIGETLKELI